MLTSVESVEQSAAIRARVEKARKLQHARFHDSKLACNADMGPAEVRQYCELNEVSRSLLRSAAQQMQLSARTDHRLLKVGRTIAESGEEQDTRRRRALAQLGFKLGAAVIEEWPIQHDHIGGLTCGLCERGRPSIRVARRGSGLGVYRSVVERTLA